jgi:hypothetical protein
MKTLISNNNGYEVLVELNTPSYDIGKQSVIFYTRWNDAKNPNELQKKFEMFLSESELKTLKDLL